MAIKAWSAVTEQEARNHQNILTKPQGSLGRLEDIACWIASRQNQVKPSLLVPHIAVFAADHGVTTEGISAFPSVVTTEMLKNFANGGAAINILAKRASASLAIIDVGVMHDVSFILGVSHKKVAFGTNNLLNQAAMLESECSQAIDVGREEAKKAIQQGANILIAGDMGIGNTTSSACLICLYTNQPVEHVVGYGTGISKDTYTHKLQVVNQAIQRVKTLDSPPHHYLQELGGLEIAAMCGFYLEAASQGVPVIIDGFIASAAALAAQQLEPEISQWMLASHVSQEQGHILALNKLNLKPLLDFNMRLGEGSGAALILPLLQSAIALHNNMATFESADISGKDVI